ncbi:MAG: Gfo/Idh/MocA family protein [Planctomycetota bacterium]|jgi:predicted dehydrogenase
MKQTRRSFLKTSSTVVAGASVNSLPISWSVNARGNDVIKVGLIGCGGRGTGAAVQAMEADPSVRLVAMADLFEDVVQAKRKVLEKTNPTQVMVDDNHCFIGFDGYKKIIDSGVDVALIANASRFQATHFETCVDAGVHTFVEKPAAMDPPDVKRVLTAAEKADEKGLSVISGQMWRYDPTVQETVKRIHDGAIGEVVAIQITTHRSNFRLRPRRLGQSEIEYQLYNWTHFSWLSGDFMTASLVHHTDLAAWVMKEEQPITAFGMGGRAALFGEEHGDCFDHNAVIYEYANGVKLFAFLIVQPNCYTEVSDIVMGTKGRAHLQKGLIEGQNPWRYRGKKGNPYQIEQDELFASIRRGRPINNGHYMALSAMTGIMGQMATYTGKKIKWDQALNAGHVFGKAECDFSTEPPVKPLPDGTYPVRIPGVSRLDKQI